MNATDSMLKLTVRLFIKAFIIGILLSLGLQQVPGEPLPGPGRTAVEHSQAPLSQPTTDLISPFPASTGN